MIQKCRFFAINQACFYYCFSSNSSYRYQIILDIGIKGTVHENLSLGFMGVMGGRALGLGAWMSWDKILTTQPFIRPSLNYVYLDIYISFFIVLYSFIIRLDMFMKGRTETLERMGGKNWEK